MRLFVAVDLAAPAVDHLEALLEPLRAAWPSVRWGSPSRWHLTLSFLGDVDDVRRHRLLARMDDAIGAGALGGGGPPTLSLAGAGTFPPSATPSPTFPRPPILSPRTYQRPGYVPELKIGEARTGHPAAPATVSGSGKPRVLWIGVAGDRARLGALATAAATAARRSAIALERRPYRPHITIGRTRAPQDLTDLVAALAPYAGPTWTVEAVHLFASHLGPSPRHERLASWPLPPPNSYGRPTPHYQA